MRFDYQFSRNEYDVFIILDDDPEAGEVLAGNIYHDYSLNKWYYQHESNYSFDEDDLRTLSNKCMQLKLFDPAVETVYD